LSQSLLPAALGCRGVDEHFDAFVLSLPDALRVEARSLAHTLGLAPSPDVPWSQVFGHAITLGAPAFVAEAAPELDGTLVYEAVAAHMFAVIEAFLIDRVEDAQVAPSVPLMELREALKRARDSAIARVSVTEGFALAEATTLAAIKDEQHIFSRRELVPFSRYLALSLGKQQLGIPASLALARRAGWDARRRRALTRALESVWMGLQLHDDAVDWEDDLARGGAWAFALAQRADEDERHAVLGSGVLARILCASARSFRGARRLSACLGAKSLAVWASERERRMHELWRGELRAPGFAHREHALQAWMRLVLA